MTTTATPRPRKRAVPATAPKPQDRKTKAEAAREADATDGFVTVEHCGVTLRVPVRGKVPMTAIVAFRNGDEIEGTRILLGDKQWEAFLAAKPLVDDFNELGSKIQEAAGN
ncbi:hypothetical protein [Tsukamurella sp. 1534]|uniref:hypothetical protein n=1 Tax=Tsukamurella sp. 1534 TaxID=1151061 RepID=UPI00031EC93B|nr:hypothetical protein [Tsukamurella sp. 1534]